MADENPGGLTIQEAADGLGVHYMTVYRYIRTGRLPARYQNGRWRIEPAALEGIRPGGPGRRSPVRSAPAGSAQSGPGDGTGQPGPDRRVDRLLGRLLAGDGPGSWAVVESALLALSPAEVHLELIAPCLRTLGAGWADGSVSVAEEHRASALVISMLGRLAPMFNRPGRRRPGLVLLAGAEGDHHAVPLILVGDLLRAAGFDIVQLGPDVPADTLAALAASPEVKAVGLSASTAATAAAAARSVAAVRAANRHVAVFAGGPALPTEKTAAAIGADGWAADGAGAVDLLERWADAGWRR